MAVNILLTWENLTVVRNEKHYGFWKEKLKSKVILNDVSGKAKSGKLIAIMGPSGSGKTTLLGAISGRLIEKQGVIKINDKTASPKFLRGISEYIQQEDIFIKTLSVAEHLDFMIAIKLGEYKASETQLKDKLIDEFNLERCRNTIINHLSGGEKRRLSLACSLINNPFILFCDEITTGLDSFSAMSVISKIQTIANEGKIVVMTVHQPSSQVFGMFSDVILLSNGKLVIQGNANQVKSAFESINLFCPNSYNPADFYINCMSSNTNQLRVLEKFNETEVDTAQFTLLNNLKIKKNRNSFCYELKWLMWRMMIDNKRNYKRFLLNYSLLTLTAFILAGSYSAITIQSPQNSNNIQGSMLMMISELIFTHMYYLIYTFPNEIHILAFEKELYSTFPYFFSKLLTVIPICFINSLTFLSVYFMFLKFLHGISFFAILLGILFLTSTTASALGLCLSAIFETVEHINLFIVPLELLIMLLSGIWIKIDTVPIVFRIIKYFSPFYSTFQSVSILMWGVSDYLGNCSNHICYTNGMEVLDRYGFFKDYNSFIYNILYLVILLFVYCCIGFVGIVRKRKRINFY